MHKTKKENYNKTIYASYIGYITQAIVNNFAPLLFLTFATTYSLSLKQITLITTVNFAVQLCVDLISTKLIDQIGYRVSVVAAHFFAAAGLLGLAFLPELLPDPYAGLLIAVFFYAIGGGLIEVLISPIVEACPTEKKEAAMSLLHSFYCWGHVFLVLASTLFFYLFEIENWNVLAVIWAAVPLANLFFFLKVPIYPIVAEHEKMELKSLLKNKAFWLIIVVMVCAGASEQAMSQWASAFAESALSLSKTIGDLAGPCTFAVFMGTARALYGKFSDRISLKRMMILSAIACIVCYLIAALSQNQILGLVGCSLCGFTVGIFWPGTFSIAAQRLPGGGTAMYALMALAGDIGCSAGPTVVGFVADQSGDNLRMGIGVAILFPILILGGIVGIAKK